MSTGPCTIIENIVIPGEDPFRINLTYFVDVQYGDDATGERDNPARPYRTINAPSLIATPGTVIYVRPGIYTPGVIQLRQGVAWYFDAGVILNETSFVGNASSAILGHATFQNTVLPVLDYNGTGGILFEADTINYSAPDYAFLVRGVGETNIHTINLEGSALRTSDSEVDVVFIAVHQSGRGIMQADQSSSGHIVLDFKNATNFARNSIIIRANVMDVTFESQAAISTSDYFIDIQDGPSFVQSGINLNMIIDRLECFGLVRSIGIPSVTNVRMQPSLNLHISTIESVGNALPNPIVDLSYTFCNLVYNRLSFAYLTPIRFIFVLGDVTVLTTTGGHTYNSDQSVTGDVGFLQTTGTAGESIANMNLSEVNLTSRVVEANGFSVVYLNIINLTNIIDINNSTWSISNAGRMGIFVRNALITSTVSEIIVNDGDMFIESDNIEVSADDTIFIQNNSRMQTKIGRIISGGNDNIFINSRGLSGFSVGTITMTGQSNLGILVVNGRTTVNIGQIDGSALTGNAGIFVRDDSQLLGSIIAIRTYDNFCLSMQTSGNISNVKIGLMQVLNQGLSGVILGDRTNLILNCDYMLFPRCFIPISISNQGVSQFNVGRLDIIDCQIGIRITGGPGCINTFNFRDFSILNNASVSGIGVENGVLTITGNLNMSTVDRSGLFLVNNSSKLYANLGFVSSTYFNLITDSFEEIWYSSQRSAISDVTGNNVLCNVTVAQPTSTTMTLSGMFLTPGPSNFSFQGGNNPSVFRLLNPYLVAPSTVNIDASINPMLTVLCNYGVCNNGTANTLVVPGGSLVTDGAIS